MIWYKREGQPYRWGLNIVKFGLVLCLPIWCSVRKELIDFYTRDLISCVVVTTLVFGFRISSKLCFHKRIGILHEYKRVKLIYTEEQIENGVV